MEARGKGGKVKGKVKKIKGKGVPGMNVEDEEKAKGGVYVRTERLKEAVTARSEVV